MPRPTTIGQPCLRIYLHLWHLLSNTKTSEQIVENRFTNFMASEFCDIFSDRGGLGLRITRGIHIMMSLDKRSLTETRWHVHALSSRRASDCSGPKAANSSTTWSKIFYRYHLKQISVSLRDIISRNFAFFRPPWVLVNKSLLLRRT